MKSMLILTDLEELGRVVQAIALKAGFDAEARTYAEFRSRPLMEDEDFDLVVLDLLRIQEGHLWAQGLSLLGSKSFANKRCLVISPLLLSEQIDCHGYWDVEAHDSLLDRMTALAGGLASPERNRGQLLARFEHLMARPKGHASHGP